MAIVGMLTDISPAHFIRAGPHWPLTRDSWVTGVHWILLFFHGAMFCFVFNVQWFISIISPVYQKHSIYQQQYNTKARFWIHDEISLNNTHKCFVISPGHNMPPWHGAGRSYERVSKCGAPRGRINRPCSELWYQDNTAGTQTQITTQKPSTKL